MDTKTGYTPHRVLSPYYKDEKEKQTFLRSVFDESAIHYERIASWGFFGTGNWYRRQALVRGGLKPGMKAIDIASGTGITARAIADIAGGPEYVTCVEPSLGMLKESQRLLKARHQQGSAESIPEPDEEYDFLSMGFALRHVDDLKAAFKEFYRVLKPSGKLFIMDITKPRSQVGNFFLKLYFRDFLPRFTKITTGSPEATYLMEYYWETLDQMVPSERVLEALSAAGFEQPKCHVVQGIFSEYSGMKK